MKVVNKARAICVYAFRTNTPVTMIMTPKPQVGTNRTCLTASIGNNSHYYPTLNILL
jgi:hypothetical protein